MGMKNFVFFVIVFWWEGFVDEDGVGDGGVLMMCKEFGGCEGFEGFDDVMVEL